MDDWICRLLNTSSDLVEITAKVATGEVSARQTVVPLKRVVADLRKIIVDCHDDDVDAGDSPSKQAASIIRLIEDVMGGNP